MQILAKLLFALLITDVYRIIPIFTPISTSLVGVLLLTFLVILIFRKLRVEYREESFFLNRNLIVILFTFLIVPTIVNVISIFTFSANTFDTLSWLVKVLWFLSFSVFIALYHEEILSKNLVRIIVCILLISFCMNSLVPEFFVIVAKKYGVILSYAEYGDIGSRFMGFYLHPNSAALSILLIMFCLYIVGRLEIALYLILIFLILLTGSRTALIISVIFSFYFLRYKFELSRFVFHKVYNVNRFIILCIASIAILVIGMLAFAVADNSLIDRLSNLGNVSKDESVMIRSIAQKQYVRLFWDNPFLGYGFDFIRDSIDKGILIRTSHNMLLERLVQYGIIGLLTYIMFFIYFSYLLFVKNGKRFILPLLFFYGLFINSFEVMLSFYFFLGVLIFQNKRG